MWALTPAVADQRADHVHALGDEFGDVIGLHLQPTLIRGEPRAQFLVGYALAVDERFVDAVRGRVEPRRSHWPADYQLTREMVDRSLHRRASGRFGRFDPLRGPVIRVRQWRRGKGHAGFSGPE
jgi:hypothetical protein